MGRLLKFTHKRHKLSAKYSRSANLFLAPVIVWFILFTIIPMGFAFYLTFHKWSVVNPEKPFVGIANYLEFSSDRLFLVSLRNTFSYVMMYTPLSLLFSLGIALMLNAVKRFESFLRIAYFAPVITSVVAVSIVWRWLYQPTFGLFNTILSVLHLPEQPWLTSPGQALFSIAIMSVWKSLGFNVIIFLAGLQSIPKVYYEAAWIDGANRRACFFHMTLPLLKPTIAFVLIMTVLGSFQVFAEPYMMTNPIGGPLNSTRVLVLHIYEEAFRWLRMGYGSSMAFVLFGIILLVTMLQWKFLKVGKRIM